MIHQKTHMFYLHISEARRLLQLPKGDGATDVHARSDDYSPTELLGCARVTFTYDPSISRTTMIDSLSIAPYAVGSTNLLTGKTDAGALGSSYAYDAAVERIQSVDPERGVWTYTYDGDGNLISIRDPSGGVTTQPDDSSSGPTTDRPPV